MNKLFDSGESPFGIIKRPIRNFAGAMRPITPTATESSTQSTATYLTWLSTARCVVSLIYQHNTDRSKFNCSTCYNASTSEEKAHFTHKVRHYIYIGTPHRFEQCATCQASLATARHTSECRICHQELIHFLNFLQITRQTPHLNGEITILHLMQLSA